VSLSIFTPSDAGPIPYGTLPRLILVWMSTEATRTRNKVLVLGNNLSGFMRELGLNVTGGKRGDITRLKKQAASLFASRVSCIVKRDDGESFTHFDISDEYHLWWEPKKPEQFTLFDSVVVLDEKFFNEVVNHPVPVDMRALNALKRSPMSLDVYCFLTYRMSYLSKDTFIPWEALQMQFGSDYKNDRHGRYNFKRSFAYHMKKVHTVYPEAKVDLMGKGLLLKPSPPHIKKTQIYVEKNLLSPSTCWRWDLSTLKRYDV